MIRFTPLTRLNTGWLLIAAMLLQCVFVAHELGEAEALSESAEVVHNVGLHLAAQASDNLADDAFDDCDHCCQCSGHGSHIIALSTLPELALPAHNNAYPPLFGIPSHLNERIFRPPLA